MELFTTALVPRTSSISSALACEVSSSKASGSSMFVSSSIAITSALTSSLAKVALNDNNTTESIINEINKLFALIITPRLIYIK